MFNIGFWEVVTVFIVFLLVIKPQDMPEILYSLGVQLGKLKRLWHRTVNSIYYVEKDE